MSDRVILLLILALLIDTNAEAYVSRRSVQGPTSVPAIIRLGIQTLIGVCVVIWAVLEFCK